METPFLAGVPYLSRLEENHARAINAARYRRDHIKSIDLDARKPNDAQALDFMSRTNQAIVSWMNQTAVGLYATSPMQKKRQLMLSSRD